VDVLEMRALKKEIARLNELAAGKKLSNSKPLGAQAAQWRR
jgi:hypothetical protein